MIELVNVSKAFRSGRRHVRALTGLSLRVETGGIVAVEGKSGSGKTTLLNCIGGLEAPDQGRVTCFGVDIHSLSPRKRSLFQRRNIGFIFQFGNLLSYLTVSENIAFPLTLNGIDGIEKACRVDALLDRIGLRDAKKALPGELSGGEVQRVAAARAMAAEPKLVLADEPTANLDSLSSNHLVKLMAEMVRLHGCTLVLTTHDREISVLADRLIRLQDGNLLEA